MGEELSIATANAALVVLTLQRAKKHTAFLSHGAGPSIARHALCVTTQDSLRRSVVFSDAHLWGWEHTCTPPTIEALLPSGRRPRAEDAKLRDRNAPDVCPIAILRGLLL